MNPTLDMNQIPPNGNGRGDDPTPDKKISNRAPSREQKVIVAGYFEAHIHRTVKVCAAENDTTVEDIIAHSLNLFFEQVGKDVRVKVKRPIGKESGKGSMIT